MKLNVLERIMLQQILPKEGDFTTLKIVRELQGNVGFSEEDYKNFALKTEGNEIKWSPKGNEEVEITIGDKATEMIKEALTKLDTEKKLTAQYFSLYEKFVQDK